MKTKKLHGFFSVHDSTMLLLTSCSSIPAEETKVSDTATEIPQDP